MTKRLLYSIVFLCAIQSGCFPTQIVTEHNDATRGGANTQEFQLDVPTVKNGPFGNVYSRLVDGQIWAQPLYLAGVTVNGATHNVVYVATQQNTVYAFDADSPSKSAPYWSLNLGPNNPDPQYQLDPPVNFDQWVSASQPHLWFDTNCNNTLHGVGILSTPVIVPSSPGQPDRMFVVSEHLKQGGTIGDVYFAISVINLNTGTVIKQTKVSVSEPYTFNADVQLQRAALVVAPDAAHNGAPLVYAAFGAHCDEAVNNHTYHGWVLGWDQDLNPVATFNTTPNGSWGGIWQAGNGITGDGNGYLYVATGNGTFDAPSGGTNYPTYDYASSYVKLKIAPGGALSVADWFTPYNAAALNKCDVDLASAGPLLVPYDIHHNGTNPYEVVGGGKEGVLYVLDPATLGHQSGVPDTSYSTAVQAGNGGGFQAGTYTWNANGDPNAWQTFQAAQWHIHGSPVIWKGPDSLRIYVWSEQDYLVSYPLDPSTGKFNPAGKMQSDVRSPGDAMPGGILAISATGSVKDTGIVWATLPKSDAWNPTTPPYGTLYAFDALNLTPHIWSSDDHPADNLGLYSKFVPPMIADGQVYVSSYADANPNGKGRLLVYGRQCSAACGTGLECNHGQCKAPGP